MSVKLKGSFKKFEGGLKAGPAIDKWWEDDAYVAFDADNGALMPNHSIVLSANSAPIQYSSTQKLPGTTNSFFYNGTNTLNEFITFTRTDSATYPLDATDFTIQFYMYISGAISTAYGEKRLGYPLEVVSSSPRYELYAKTTAASAPGEFKLFSPYNVATFATALIPTDEWFKIKITHEFSTNTHRLYFNDTQIGSFTGNLGSGSGTERIHVVGIHRYFDRYQIVPRVL